MTSYPPPKDWKEPTEKERKIALARKRARTKKASDARIRAEQNRLWLLGADDRKRRREREKAKAKKKKYFNPKDIWPEYPQYSDWLQDNRATYGSGMANDPLTIAHGSSPYEGYLRFMRGNYAGNPTGQPYQSYDRQLNAFLSPIDPPVDPPIDLPVDSPAGDNESVIRNSINKPRVTSQTFR